MANTKLATMDMYAIGFVRQMYGHWKDMYGKAGTKTADAGCIGRCGGWFQKLD